MYTRLHIVISLVKYVMTCQYKRLGLGVIEHCMRASGHMSNYHDNIFVLINVVGHLWIFYQFSSLQERTITKCI